jgi:hypothetical protein
MAPLWFLPLGAWAVETGRIDLGTCSLKMVANLPCWSCGSTRGTVRLLHGDVAAAVAYQPLMMTIYAVVMTWGIVSLAAFWQGKRVVLDTSRAEVWGFRAALVALPLLNWWYLIKAGI